MASYADDLLAPRLAHAEHVAQRRTTGGTGLAPHQMAYDDPAADHVGAEQWRVLAGPRTPDVEHVVVGHTGDTRLDSSVPGPDLRRIQVTYVIAQPCVDLKDRACVDECPVDCIYEGPRMLYIHPDECVDCDACVPVCPVTAIFPEDDLPSEWKQFSKVNAEWFADDVTGLGSPGGAAQAGAQAQDHPVVAGWEAV